MVLKRSWWWHSGHYAHLLLRQLELESLKLKSTLFILYKLFEKNENKTVTFGPFLTQIKVLKINFSRPLFHSF